jgi:amidohydrolase
LSESLQHFAPKVLSIFKYLHEHPEVSWKEFETTHYLAELLRNEGLSPKLFHNCTGLFVDVGVGEPKVGIRADIDALWQEVDGVERANHSCGHDGHMAMAMGAIIQLKHQLTEGAVRVIFQPAEEKGKGALKMIEMGVIDSLEYLFGVHVRPSQELQDDEYSPALYHGAAKAFVGEIVGEEAHAARPHLGQNAIEVGAAIVEALMHIHHDPMVPASYKLTRFHAGSDSTNIIPGKAEFAIDVRAQRNDVMDHIEEQILHHIAVVARLHGVKIHMKETTSIVAAEVSDEAKSLLQQAIIQTVGKSKLRPEIHTPGGEDFHYYSVYRPKLKATMLGLGCGLTPGLHHPNMKFNEKRLIEGAKILAEAARLAVKRVYAEGASKYVGIGDFERTNYD